MGLLAHAVTSGTDSGTVGPFLSNGGIRGGSVDWSGNFSVSNTVSYIMELARRHRDQYDALLNE